MADDDPLDDALRPFDPPVVVVTAVAAEERAGCVVGFHTRCSIEPPRYAVWLSKANHTYGIAVHAEHVALHLLGQDDLDLARLFGTTSGDEIDKFARCEWHEGPGGVPLLDGCGDRVVLRRTGLFDDGGDHVCFVGEPVEVTSSGSLVPLRLSVVSHLDAGHPAEDLPRDP